MQAPFPNRPEKSSVTTPSNILLMLISSHDLNRLFENVALLIAHMDRSVGLPRFFKRLIVDDAFYPARAAVYVQGQALFVGAGCSNENIVVKYRDFALFGPVKQRARPF
jgi:hypothetical protein